MAVVTRRDKRTSGRVVYQGGVSGEWWWQCDLHPCREEFCDGSEHEGEFGVYPD